MSFGSISWIAEELLVDENERRRVVGVRVESCWYGSTAGPFGGIGGSAMTEFTMTEIILPDRSIVYADKQRMGTVKPEHSDEFRRSFPYIKPHWIEMETR